MEHASPILWGQPQDPERQHSSMEESLYTKDLGPWPWASPFPSPGLTVLSNTRELDIWASPSTPLLLSRTALSQWPYSLLFTYQIHCCYNWT